MTETPTRPKLSPLEKAKQNPEDMRSAIAAYCYHECHSELANNSHTVKNDVKNCRVTECALWPFRGWQNITGGLLKRRKRAKKE